MKDYEEMARSVLDRRDAYAAEKKKRIKKMASAGACLCLTLLIGVGFWHGQTGIISGDAPVNENQGIEDLGAERKDKQAKAEKMDGDPDGYSSSEFSVSHPIGETDPLDVRDAPIAQEPGGTGALNPLDDVWGGSYMDEGGHWVVWLTENTPENQARVFEQNPDLTESSTVFKTADFSLAYLTGLMADISAEMGAQKLPFVTTAALREQDNRVVVTMTEDDEECAARVLSLDAAGGAIELLYSDAQIKNEVAQKGQEPDSCK